ncbi:hypothetical protein [Acinetobacter modestus]|uniref:hypothetical protein n=1 Tax=Acinetobacter modestus TaxID=1776740 RepID=UPI003015C2FF
MEMNSQNIENFKTQIQTWAQKNSEWACEYFGSTYVISVDELVSFMNELAQKEKVEACLVDPVWISVDFLLPDIGTKVLICISNEVISAKYTIIGFVDSIEGAMLRQDLITYWAHIPVGPEAPRGGNE